MPFHRRYHTPVSLTTRAARDRDFAIYVQDTWQPNNRLTLNLGVRADFVKRNDEIFDIVRQNSTAIGPRLGFSYLLTKDSRNVLRGSYVRVHEQVMGRDADHAVRRQRGGGPASTSYDVERRRVVRDRRRPPRRPAAPRLPTTSSPTTCTSPTSTSSSSASASSSPAS